MVQKTNEGVPVYLVKREHGRGPSKLLYWNLLFPFMALPVSNTKAKECSVSDLDGTQLLLDEKILSLMTLTHYLCKLFQTTIVKTKHQIHLLISSLLLFPAMWFHIRDHSSIPVPCLLSPGVMPLQILLNHEFNLTSLGGNHHDRQMVVGYFNWLICVCNH